MIIPPFLQRWILLNTIRLLTIVSCTLVIAATIRTLRINFQHYPPPLISSSPPSSSYYLSTDIPTTFLGVFWSTLHHVSLCLVLFTVILSELSLPIPMLNRLFKNTLPFLGPNWGTGFLGVLLVLVAADGLSRGDVGGRFAEVSNWGLASVGVGNVGVGVVWRAKAKVVRSPMGWKRDVAAKKEKLAEAKRKAERVVDELPLPATSAGEKGGGGLKDMIEVAGKAVWKVEERQAKKEQEKEEKDVDKTRVEAAAMSIFAPPLPSAIVSSRAVPLAPSPPAAAPPTSITSSPSKAASTLPPPLILPPSATPTSRASTLSTTSSVYTLDQPPFFATPTLTPPSPTLPSLTPPHPRNPPLLKTVRFQPSIHHPSTTIDSLRATTHQVEGTKFLILPSPTADGERSPSVLASLKAAMLEAQAKASVNQSKKSLYLGSDRWQAEYHNLASSEKPKEQQKAKADSERPYNFL